MAKKSGLTFEVHTPKKTWKTKNGVVANEKFYEEIQKTCTKVAMNKLYEQVTENRIDSLFLIATFFQRVVARTPLDEKYTQRDEDGKLLGYHIPDTNRCKLDWYIQSKNNKFTSEDFMNRGIYFKQIDNAEDIKKLINILNEYIWSDDSGNLIVEIGNENPHFTVLEYGGGYNWKGDTDPRTGIKVNDFDNGYKHGVKNKHSVQAPVGMLRVTQAELFNNQQTKLSRNEYTTGHKQGKRREFSDSELKELKSILQKKRIRVGDISRYLKKYK